MNHLKSFEERRSLFFQKASSKFGDQYSYEKFEYVNAKSKSTIICRDHGEFEQNPDKHLNCKYACPACLAIHKSELGKLRDVKGKPMTPEEYLARLNLPARFSIDMTGFQGFTKGTVTLTCPVHGETTYIPQSLMANGSKCARCGHASMALAMTKTFDDFVTEATVLYSGKFSYPEQPYENRKSTVVIVCPEHGKFTKKAQKHLSGQGCYVCTLERGIVDGKYPGGYSRKVFTENPELANSDGLVYYLKVGSLYKIGITSRDIRLRVKTLKYESKTEVVVLQTHPCTLREAYDIEQAIIQNYKEFRVNRSWSTELFDRDILMGQPIVAYASGIGLSNS